MKKYLYGTTSLVGVGLLAGASPVQAESDPIHLELGGFFHQWQGFVDTDVCQDGSNNCNDFDIVQVGEIFFNIVGKLDNGIEVSGLIELETQQDTDVIDAARANISGAFGTFQLGQEDSARHNWGFDTMAPNEGILINSGWETAFAATSQNTFGLLRPTHSTAVDFSDKAPKVSYFTPRFNGFQFAISWTPDTQTDFGTNPVGVGGTSGPGSLQFGTANEDLTYTNAIDLGVHYTGEFDGVGITAQAGWGTVSAPDGTDEMRMATRDFLVGEGYTLAEAVAIAEDDVDDPDIYQAGLAISFEGFTVAGSWTKVDEGMYLAGTDDEGDFTADSISEVQSTEGSSWTIGAGYTTGPWAFAASYFHGEEEGLLAQEGDDENDFFQISASYALSPGLSVNLQYLHIDREADGDPDDPGNSGTDSETDAVMLGVKVGF